MTTTIRYNYVFAFIHYYCLTALSASLFRCANVHCCTKRFLCGRSFARVLSMHVAVVYFETVNEYNLFSLFFCVCCLRASAKKNITKRKYFTEFVALAQPVSLRLAAQNCIIKICR